jgi:tetratricopeptide (TPR) repeat protein
MSGDPDHSASGNRAKALVREANVLLGQGHTTVARERLDAAAALHRAAGRDREAARCLQFAAPLCRFEGRPDEGRRRAQAALALAGDAAVMAVPAQAELGEAALAEGDFGAAVAAFGAAIALAEATDAAAPARPGLLRRRALALLRAGQTDAALHDLASAAALLEAAGEPAGVARVLVEQATALQDAGRAAAAGPVIDLALTLAAAARDEAALADLHLLLAARALDSGDAAAAAHAAERARTHALAGRAPAAYIAAAHALSKLADRTGDRVEAYAALATGWATLADLMGGDIARVAFAPVLRDLRARWGEVAFVAARAAYEAQRY